VSVRRSYAFFPEGFTHELKMDWSSWRSSVSLFGFWNSRHKHFGSWLFLLSGTV
jgi:hypothetical protein